MKIASRVVFILSSKKFQLFEKLSYPVMAMYRIEEKKSVLQRDSSPGDIQNSQKCQ